MAISCTDLKEELSCYIDGELDETTQFKVRKHLDDCQLCKLSCEQLVGVNTLLGKVHSNVVENAPDIWVDLEVKLPGVCECVQEDLSAYLDGELLPSSKEGVSAHLESCATCLEKFNELSRVNSVLAKGLELPADFQLDLWANIKQRLDDDCVLIREEISAFVDKEVTILRHRAITSHLAACAECCTVFNGLAETGDFLRSCYQPEIPDDFDLWPAIQAKMNVVPITAAKEKNVVSLSARRLLVAAAVVVLGVLASIGLYANMQSGSQVSPVTAEAYLIDSSLNEPSDVAESFAYDSR
jgi:anti-sigma factor RsiW